MGLNQINKKDYFTDQYNQNFDYVYAYIFARTAGNSQLTEDIVQETFAAAWSSLNSFNETCSPSTWFCSIAKNKLRQYYRSTICREKFEYPDSDALYDYACDFDLENLVLNEELRLRVIKVLNGIAPLYRYALIMKYMDCLSVKEIARVLARSPKAVDGVLQRAKAAFEQVYIQQEGRDGNHG